MDVESLADDDALAVEIALDHSSLSVPRSSAFPRFFSRPPMQGIRSEQEVASDGR
jgi:hypothetical protein